MEQPPSQIETWAIVEIMGHTKLAGMAKTEPFGTVMMLRVDVPELPEKRRTEKSSWDESTGQYYETPQNVEIVEPSEAAYTRYFGLQAVFSITPCDEPTARAAMERMRKSPAKTLRLARSLPGADGGPVERAALAMDDDHDDDDS
jgi:hypothetical protein